MVRDLHAQTLFVNFWNVFLKTRHCKLYVALDHDCDRCVLIKQLGCYKHYNVKLFEIPFSYTCIPHFNCNYTINHLYVISTESDAKPRHHYKYPQHWPWHPKLIAEEHPPESQSFLIIVSVNIAPSWKGYVQYTRQADLTVWCLKWVLWSSQALILWI